MRVLENNELPYVAGSDGRGPGLACSTTSNATKSADGALSVTENSICQTSSGLTVIQSTTTNYVEVGIGTTKIGKALGIKASVEVQSQTTTTTVCKPDGKCEKNAGDNFGGSDGGGGMLLPDDEATMMC